MTEGLSHLTFIVGDLERMTVLLETVLGARELYASGDHPFSIAREKFFDVGGIWVAVLEGDSLPTRTYNHVAFKIADQQYDDCLARVKSLGLDVQEGRPRVAGEGRSIYFHDHDNHLFELHTGTLAERLACYAQGKPPA